MQKDKQNSGQVDVVRAWKDRTYRASLTDAQRAELPPNPAEMDMLDDELLEGIVGGTYTIGCYQPTGTGGD